VWLKNTCVFFGYSGNRGRFHVDMIPVKPERKAQLEDYAQRHGQDTAAALDDVLSAYLEWERQDFQEASGTHATRR
jgi:hypothetical protein